MGIYRHKFAEEISEKIAEFSAEYGGASLADFKKQWSSFLTIHRVAIDKEVSRLHDEGMTADVVEKMFTSARYWHTKKHSVTKICSEKAYVTTTKAFLEAIDAHIQKTGSAMKPSDAFADFCEQNLETLKTEIAHLKAVNISADDIRTKIKKTYKNRHFVITKRVTQ